MASTSAPPGPPNGRISFTRSRANDNDAASTGSGDSTSDPKQQRTSGRINTGYFPLGYKDGFSQWWASLAPAVTEHKVLSFIPHLRQPPTHLQTGTAPPSATTADNANGQVDHAANKEASPVTTSAAEDPYGPRQWRSRMVDLRGANRALNEFSVERLDGHDTKHTLVMLHGYGAGLGFFYKNFEGLSRRPGWQLYALDLLGMGRSSRPPFRIAAKDREAGVREAEAWFVDALEEWRRARGIDKMTLLGHSLGGYLAVCYALKYPGHLEKLILASPVGIPEDPYAVRADLPSSADLANSTATSSAPPAPPPRKPLPRWLTTLWDANVSPFSLVRLSGPLGPRLVSGWTSRRFAHLPPDEATALHDYAYSLFRQRGSGEYALAYILAPGAFARSPLLRRIQDVGRGWIPARDPELPAGPGMKATAAAAAAAPPPPPPPAATAEEQPPAVPGGCREPGLPIVLLYGEHDWMDITGGHAAAARLQQTQKEVLAAAAARSPEEGRRAKERENGDVRVGVIRAAGHHVYLDGWRQFNAEMDAEMADVERRAERIRKVEQEEEEISPGR